jgi:hypothetical protein
MPDWQLEPDEEMYGANTQEGLGPPLVDENGNPIGPQPADPMAHPGTPAPGGPDQTELDRIFNSPPPQREPQRVAPPREAPRSDNSADPLEPRPETTQR